MDKEIGKATTKRSKLADNLAEARKQAEETQKAINEIDARLDAARGAEMGKVRAEYPGMSDTAAADVANSRAMAGNKDLLKQAEKLETTLSKQKEKAAQISEAYAEQERLTAGLNERHDTLVSQLKEEQDQAAALAQQTASDTANAAEAQKAASRVSSSFERFGTRLRHVISSALIFNVISAALRGVVSTMGAAIVKTDGVSSALARLKGAASTAAAGFAAVLAPTITWVINLLTTLASAFAKLMASLSGKSIASLKSTAKKINAVGSAAGGTSQKLRKAASSLAAFDEIERLNANSDSGSGGASYDFDKMTSPLDAVSEKMKKFWTDFRELLSPSAEAWSAAWEQIKAKAAEVWPAIQDAAQSLKDDALVPLLEYLGTVFAPGVINAFSEAFAPITGDVISAAIQIFADFFVWVCGVVADGVNSILRPALDLILLIWQDMMAGVQAAWSEYGQPICDGLIEAFRGIESIFSELWESFVKPVLQHIIELVQELWSEHLKPLWDDLVALIASIGNCLLTLWNEVVSPLLGWIISTFGPGFTEVFNLVADGVKVAVGFIADTLDIALIALKGVTDFLTAVFRGDWDAAWQAISDTVTKVWDKIQGTIKDAINGIVGFINGMISAIVSGINFVGNALNDLSFDVPDWVPGLGGKSFGFSFSSITAPQIPYLAQGAVIPANREFLAVLGDQHSGTNVEAPLDVIKQAVAEVMEDLQAGQMAGFEAVVGVLREILSAVYGIELTDEDVGRAVQRWQRKQEIATGGA